MTNPKQERDGDACHHGQVKRIVSGDVFAPAVRRCPSRPHSGIAFIDLPRVSHPFVTPEIQLTSARIAATALSTNAGARS
jgi:hypothetical protein